MDGVLLTSLPTWWNGGLEGTTRGDDGVAVDVRPLGSFEPVLEPLSLVGVVGGDVPYRIGVDDLGGGLDPTVRLVGIFVRLLVNPVVAGVLDLHGEVAAPATRPNGQPVALVLQLRQLGGQSLGDVTGLVQIGTGALEVAQMPAVLVRDGPRRAARLALPPRLLADSMHGGIQQGVCGALPTARADRGSQ